MSLLSDIRSQLVSAMKSKNETEKNIFRVVLGEVATLQGRTGKEPIDDDIKKIVKKLIQSNEETIGNLTSEYYRDMKKELIKENEILLSVVPPTIKLSCQEIKNRIMLAGAPIFNEIKECKSDGQAIGACIKYLKSYNWEADSKDVGSVVKELRS